MLTYRFSASDVARTRFAISPLWETVLSVRTALAPVPHEPHQLWRRRVEGMRAVAGIDLLAALVPARGCLPDFLTPTLSGRQVALDGELDTLLATRPAVVRRDLHATFPRGVPDLLADLEHDPSAGLLRVADALQAWFDVILRPDWTRIHTTLESDIEHRARDLARGGIELLLADLDRSLSFDGEALRVQRPCHTVVELTGTGLVLVPSAFVWPGVLSIAHPPLQPALLYPARGVGRLWTQPEEDHTGSLHALLGRGRAQVLLAARSPVTTTEIARSLGMAPGGVSRHLSVLRKSGLVRARRAGRAVLYERTALADTLVRSV
jgi:hypothetical protein